MSSPMRKRRSSPRFAGLLALLGGLMLTACGGDDTIVAPPPPDGGGNGPPVAISDLSLIASTVQLPSDASAAATISAIVRDANNNVVPDVSVIFSSNGGLLQVISGTTNDSGIAQAELSIADDPTNRAITVNAEAGSLSASLDIQVVGTTLTLSGPASMVQGDTVTYTAVLTDSAGGGLAGRTVDVSSASGNMISASSLTTNGEGEATFQLTATAPGDDTLSAMALGLTATADLTVSNDSFAFIQPPAGTEVELGSARTVVVEWLVGGAPQGGTVNFSTTRGTLSAATVNLDASGRAQTTVQANTAGPATLTAQVVGGPTTSRNIEFVATNPTKISVQASRTSVAPGGQSTITATVRDPNDNPVKNEMVVFQLEDTSGGSLSVGQATTNSNGQATTVYTAGATPSASQGVAITGTVQSNPAATATVNLTVALEEVDIVIGTGNEISEPNSATYSKEFLVIVTDSQGVGINGATVQLTALSKEYLKGIYVAGANNQWVPQYSASCPDEDANRNNQLDPGEDFNNSGSIEAGNVASVSPGTVTTDASGQAVFNLSYPQEFGNWVVVTLQARAPVSGTEFLEQTDYGLEVSVADVALSQSPPGGVESRWGSSASCGDTN